MTDQTKYVYDLSEGDASLKPLLGGKGANLAEMAKIGVPVPDAFTVTTQACVAAMNNGGEWPEGLAEQIDAGLSRLEERTGKTLGSAQNPPGTLPVPSPSDPARGCVARLLLTIPAPRARAMGARL